MQELREGAVFTLLSGGGGVLPGRGGISLGCVGGR